MLLPCLLALVAGAVRGETPQVGLREEARVRLRTVRLRVEAREPRQAAACLALSLDDLKVALRGEAVDRSRLVALERPVEPTLHLLLLDMSGSVYGWLDYVREAAEAYVRQLDPSRERAMLATFDDSLVLERAPTADLEDLAAAARGLRMGGSTGLVDALWAMLLEVEAHRERPVIVLVTDGVDAGSLHDRAHVHDLAEGRPEVIAFTIGLDVPPISRGARSGVASSRRFLQNLARRTNGRYFEHPTGRDLDRTFLEIRSVLEAEAVLTFLDPRPEGEPGKVVVTSRDPACEIVTYREHGDGEVAGRTRAIPRPWPAPPLTLDLPPDPPYQVRWVRASRGSIDPACVLEGDAAPDPWRLEVGPRSMRACALDVTMEPGRLYDFHGASRARYNHWLEQTVRPLEIAAVPLADLPRDAVETLDALARYALSVAGRPVRTGAHQVPVERHARPFHDWPALCSGQTFFHIRPRLARGLFAYPWYRDWVLGRLQDEARRELAVLRERLRKIAPELDEAELDRLARISEQGRSIVARAAAPSEVDLQRYLAAWLGDIPAHDLFVGWERRHVERLLHAGEEATPLPFERAWSELRKLFFVPSYARVLTLLRPVHDPARDRIGYWRVVLPRPSWFGQRVQGWKNRVEYSDLPLDLVPDRPLALAALRELCAGAGGLCRHLGESGYRVSALSYELPGKPWKQGPERAFREARVTLSLVGEAGGGGAPPRLDACFEFEPAGGEVAVLARATLEVRDDARLERLAAPVRPRYVPCGERGTDGARAGASR